MRQTVYVTDFTVEGRGVFPIDMLRSDECWPADGDAVMAMNASFGDFSRDHRHVKLRTHIRGGPTIARWKSFGWRVAEVQP